MILTVHKLLLRPAFVVSCNQLSLKLYTDFYTGLNKFLLRAGKSTFLE